MILGIFGGVVLFMVIALAVKRQKDIVIEGIPKLNITSPAFANDGEIPVDYTGNGKDLSPELCLTEVDKNAETLAVIMDDMDHPLVGVYNHWLIWNIPVQEKIPSGIPAGKKVAELTNAVQGIGYGKHRYRGPKPPFGSHRYKYNVFVLDTSLELPASANKKELLEAMDGHLLQYGYLIGQYGAN